LGLVIMAAPGQSSGARAGPGISRADGAGTKQQALSADSVGLALVVMPDILARRAAGVRSSRHFRLQAAARAAVGKLPNGRLASLPGQGHDISPEATAPVIADFLTS
jgi:hypothetical protein